MTPGILKKTLGEKSATATMTPDGWRSEDATFQGQLERLFPIKGTEAGVGWVIAFWEAVKVFGAEVVQEPDAGGNDAAP